MPRIVRVASVQSSPVGYDLPLSLLKARKLVREAKEAGAKMVVLPEAFLSAYPRHMPFAIGSRTEESREWFGRYVEVSQSPRFESFWLSFKSGTRYRLQGADAGYSLVSLYLWTRSGGSGRLPMRMGRTLRSPNCALLRGIARL
jgi:hypothetical protein